MHRLGALFISCLASYLRCRKLRSTVHVLIFLNQEQLLRFVIYLVFLYLGFLNRLYNFLMLSTKQQVGFCNNFSCIFGMLKHFQVFQLSFFSFKICTLQSTMSVRTRRPICCVTTYIAPRWFIAFDNDYVA